MRLSGLSKAELPMKTAGLLGGMSWESTVPYYQTLNREVGRVLGGLHSARLILLSVDFQEIERLQHEDRWEELGSMLADEGRRLEKAGAEFLVLCTNTMHRVAPAIEDAVGIPLLHIADATAEVILDAGIDEVGLLGTRFTMEQEFYRGRLEKEHGLAVRIPNAEERTLVHRVIYEELVLGRIEDRSREAFQGIVGKLVHDGAQGVILGCTEIGLLLGSDDASVPLFDTAVIHAEAAASFLLGGNS